MEKFLTLAQITFKSPGEIFISPGIFDVHWYGIIIAIAFLAGLGVSLHIAKQENIDSEKIINLATLLLVGGIVFARMYYVIFSWDYFSLHPAEIFMLWKGGLSIHGVIIGCFFFLLIYARIKNISLLKYTDLFACALPLGQAIGRWGNFFNSEAFGTPTDLPLRVYIPPENRPSQYFEYEYFHPAFLYESIWNLAVFFVLFYVIRPKFRATSGVVTLSYLILYSVGRFFIEIFRTDNIYSIMGLHIAQFISLLLILTGISGLIMLFCNKKISENK